MPHPDRTPGRMPERAPRRGLRPGWSLVEVMVGLAIGSLVLLGALRLAQTAMRERRLVRQRANVMLNALQVNAAVRGDLEHAGRATFSAYNWSGVNVAVAGPDSAATDTLLVLAGLGPAYRNSAQLCQGAAVPGATRCVVLVGALGDSLHVGDVVVTGAPSTGAVVGQVVAVTVTTPRPCGSDCGLEAAQCTDTPTGTLMDAVVTGSTIHHPDGSATTSTSPCAESYFSDGSWCEEQSALQAVGSTIAPSCAVTASPAQVYTEVQLADRTAQFGYPTLATFTAHSGATGTPQVVTQRLSLARYWVDHTNELHPTLVKQIGLASNGSWGQALPVAGDVLDFRVAVQHVNQTAFTRGTGVTAASLAMTGGNTNFIRTTTTPATSVTPGYTFTTSYRTIVAVAVRYTVFAAAADPQAGAPQRLTLTTLAGTNALLRGGVVSLYP